MNKQLVLLSIVVLVFSLLFSCNKKITVEEARERIEGLVARGVPESEMSKIRMYLFNMESAKSTGNQGPYRRYRSSLDLALNEFEERMVVLLDESGPIIDSLKEVVEEKKGNLKGLHLEAADSLLAAFDSLVKTNQLLLARTRLEQYNLKMDTLITMQNVADSLRNQFVGAWVMEKESPDRRFNVVERTEIHMRRDGTLYIMESKRGRTSESTREDWEFRSTGTWDLKGDIAYHYIENEKRIRQNFHTLDPQTGRWRKESKPAYDSTFTDGSRDRYAAYSALKEDYRKFPIRN
ncbi:hypothetical protein QA601_08260 [Chitinispirillales bacterium ANBcel5]|uniref:hypothetical protein n=1 Tax=Cellulosispirillum alkaliphilum TaxID=3039283 RepID=UPI002A560934|nr:hypothetical protein [Chitinispirillales bacterium ANBcel5]